jgi:hypothetical protein
VAYTYEDIIDLAKRSGIPFKVGSDLRPGATVKYTGKPSLHAEGKAVDFSGYSQDQLAEFMINAGAREVFHKSVATGKWYGWSKGKPVPETAHGGELAKDHENHVHAAFDEAGVGPGSFLDNLRKGIASVGAALSPALGPLAKFIPNPGNVTEALGSMGTGIYSIAQSAVGVGTLANTITQLFLPTKIMRGAMFLLGMMFMLIGIWFLSREIKESKA